MWSAKRNKCRSSWQCHLGFFVVLRTSKFSTDCFNRKNLCVRGLSGVGTTREHNQTMKSGWRVGRSIGTKGGKRIPKQLIERLNKSSGFNSTFKTARGVIEIETAFPIASCRLAFY